MAAEKLTSAFSGMEDSLAKASTTVAAAQRDGFASHLADPAKRQELESQLEGLIKSNTETDPSQEQPWLKDAREGLAAMRSIAAGGQWSKDSLGTSSKEGYSFDGPAYRMGASKTQHEAEVSRVERSGRVSSTWDDDKLSRVATSAGQLARAIESGDDSSVERAATSLGTALGNNRTQELLQGALGRNAKSVADESTAMAESAERLRALKKITPQQEAPTQTKQPAGRQDEFDGSPSNPSAVANRLRKITREWQAMAAADPAQLTAMYGVAQSLERNDVARARQIMKDSELDSFTELKDLFDDLKDN